ncbi:branched-chain amino acid ABC transporter permease [Microvirga pudoricolor]|uniref:branched-chain amino acid ABC transporter permease n=1 Tax=Microvirga pudoricolor TaxID=2778729 RepID=UPI00194EB274|nr:branched-chain amino acid ABC transporter permease [Microvirga pudoricolor]MBM6595513.1 branched-chain amino acid ABC transporter permease [Microvirga pudoricolor]
MGRLALCFLGLSLLAACGFSVDAEQARVCRTALPALNPGGRITVLRAEAGPGPRSVRIDYSVDMPNRRPLDRSILCQFAADGLSPNKAELTGILTERGPLPGANLYLLKRYYIETPEGVAGDPGGELRVDASEIPFGLAYALQQLLAALPRIGIYALLSVAYALVFGLTGRISLAFGELAAVGGAATVAGAAIALVALGVTSPFVGLGLGMAAALFAGALFSAVGNTLAITRITTRSSQPSLIATVGLSVALMEFLRLAQSPVTVWLPPLWSGAIPVARSGAFVVSLTPVSLLVAGIALVAASVLLWTMQGTRFGRAWRASADDARMAAILGVDERRLALTTFALAGAMAGLSGLLIVTQYGGIGFAAGFQYGLKALIAAIIGGIGSIPGALLGGVAVGLFETFWSAYLPIEGRDIALYGALAVFLIFRPGGFLGLRESTPRPV